MISSVGTPNTFGISSEDFKTKDIETLLMMVQSRRVDGLDQQLRIQLKEIEQRNMNNQKLTELMNKLSELSNLIGGGDSTKKVPKDMIDKYTAEIKTLCEEAGIEFSSLGFNAKDIEKTNQKITSQQKEVDKLTGIVDSYKNEDGELSFIGTLIDDIRTNESNKLNKLNEKLDTYTNKITTDTNKGEIDLAINKIKGMVDTNNSTNQMDMLRLQQMTSKRNEAFDLMSNVAKKGQDGRSSIIGNMR